MFKMIKITFMTFIKFLDKHLIWALLAGGALSYFLGVLFSNFVPTLFLSEPFKSLSKIIIGTGFFTGLTKSSYYANFFQNKVFNVFYQPGEHFSKEELTNKWINITRYLLENKAGKSSKTVSEIIFQRYLSTDMEYHFKNMTITYDIALDVKEDEITITQNMEAYIVINKDVDEIELEHKVLTDGDMELLHLMIDDEIKDQDNCYLEQTENANIKILKTKVKNKQRSIKLNRCYRTKQCLSEEPFIMNNYSRYVNGLVVRYKTTHCTATFRLTGVITDPENQISHNLDGNGYTHTVIAKQEDLTLPGQGFILILSKEDTGE